MMKNRQDLYKSILKKISCLGVFLWLSFFVIGCGKEVKAPVYDDTIMPVKEVSVFAIVSGIDEVNGKLTFRAVDFETEIELIYTGGVDITDKYGDLLTVSQVELGSIVDIVYDANRDKLLSMQISDHEKVQKMEGVSGAKVDNLAQTIEMNGLVYPMDHFVSAYSDNRKIEVNEICTEDQITVWLYNDIVYSIYVELGHGYVRLSDYSSYIGGMVEIGYDVIVPVTEDMLLTVREGEYTLRIEKGDNVGTKKVKVIKNQEINLSLADIAIMPEEVGSVHFKITPANAFVYIDGKRVNPEGAIDLNYGKHRIQIMAEGYQSYSASFNVNYAYKIKEYTLKPEEEKKDKEESKKPNQSTSESDDKLENQKEEEEIKDVTKADGKKTSNKVTISTPEGASVYFDGEYMGILPISFTKVTGSHIITFSKKGYLSKSYTVNFTDDGKDINLKYDDLISISSLVQ